RTYVEVRGVAPPGSCPRASASLVYDVALPRLRQLADAGGFPLTLFTIGSDLARREASVGLRGAGTKGDGNANPSLDHRYDLVRLGRAEITRQISEGARVIEEATG